MLLEDLREVRRVLARFPESGFEIARGADSRAVRRLRLPRVPFFVWYAFDPAGGGTVTLLRLFHTRQRTPAPSF